MNEPTKPKTIDERLASIEQTQIAQVDLLERVLGVMNQILSGMAGDGSGELVAALNRLADGQDALKSSIYEVLKEPQP